MIALLAITSTQFVALPQEIRLHEKSNITVRYSEVFKSVDFIKLETNPECLISSISSIKFDDDKIFIFDSRQYKLLIFNIDGSFVTKIGQMGKGPGEMLGPTDFTLDRENNRVEILDAPSTKTLVYDYDGNYLKTFKSVYASGFEKLESNKYLAYSYNYPIATDKVQIHADLIGFDEQGKVLKEFQKIRTIPDGIGSIMSNLILDNEGNAYLIPIFETRLFKIDKNFNITKTWDIVFDTKIPKNPYKNARNFQDLGSTLSSKKYPGIIYRLTSVKNMISFIFTYQGKGYNSFFNIQDNSTISVQSDNFINDLAFLESKGFRGQFNDGLIAYYSGNTFRDIYLKSIEDDPEMKIIESKEMKDRLSSLYKNTKPADNPILFLYTYR